MRRILGTGLVLTFLFGSMVQAQSALSRSHSHNNYLHPNSLQDALHFGFISVEADVLWKEGQLYIGHDRIDLDTKPLVTLEELYLSPLFERFEEMDGHIYKGFDGLFYLWIDIKYSGMEVCRVLLEQIDPYKPMLYSATENPDGKIMLIISGDRPMDLIVSNQSFLHLDGRPEDLGRNISSERMPFVSQHIAKVCPANARGYLDELEVPQLKHFVNACHSEGKLARLWASPENRTLWSQLIAADIDLINTDSLEKYADFILSPH